MEGFCLGSLASGICEGHGSERRRSLRPCPSPASLQPWLDVICAEPEGLYDMPDGLCGEMLGRRCVSASGTGCGSSSSCGSPTPSSSSSCSSGIESCSSSYSATSSDGAFTQWSSCCSQGQAKASNQHNAAEWLAALSAIEQGDAREMLGPASKAAASAAACCSPSETAQWPGLQQHPQQAAPTQPSGGVDLRSRRLSPGQASAVALPATPTTLLSSAAQGSDPAPHAAEVCASGMTPAAVPLRSAAPAAGQAPAVSPCLDFLGVGMVPGLKPLNVPRHVRHFAAAASLPSSALPPLSPLASNTASQYCSVHQAAAACVSPRLLFWPHQGQQQPAGPSLGVAVLGSGHHSECAVGSGAGSQRRTGLRRSPGCGDLRRVGVAAEQAAVVDALVGLVVNGLFD
ncbi:hypothetical protein CHLRE_10g449127v5 [Chlamydomonas reinhardtii]|uniref:Uncharacterized protein n=1 Tax=Chlamydomonas reinhardtii TaxID=3055 RepID=A0A2K3DB21_CHLRE|nr:uncharacterized protein CHLRE_10g449127v5 [Chlamydomonas reinhardtii]PNW77729.1 hypothetical protein CHLRE_10g449127v5 [Chlamydomonas reinhardtii]